MTSSEIHNALEGIPGWFSEEDIQGFMGLEMPEKPRIMECGTYCGRSARAFQLIWPGAKITTCDPIDEPDRQLTGVEFINERGVNVELPGKPVFDLLFIDDSHWYDDIKANFEHFIDSVKPGGYVVFHDYWFETDHVDGVRRFVNELGNCNTDSKGTYGLAIWRKS